MDEKLKYEWIKRVNENIIWICQLPRSGGTLLLRLFDSHPEFHCYPAVFGFNNHDRIWPSLNFFEHSKEKVVENVFSYMNLEKFHLKGIKKQSSNMKQKTYPIYYNSQWYREIIMFCLNGKRPTPRDYFDAFFTALFNSWRNNQNLYGNKKYIIGQMTLRKPELYTENYRNFKKVYPQGKIIFIVRKPEDWLASAIELKKHTPYTSNPYEIIEQYKIHLRQAIKLSKNKNFIIFKFEDLILWPKNILHKLIKQLKVQWNECLMAPTFNGAPFYQNSSFNIEKKSVIDPSVVGRGRELPKIILKAIDNECISLYGKIVAEKSF